MQSIKLRIGLAAGALALAAVLFVVLHGGGGSDSGSVATGTTKISYRGGVPVGGVRDIEVHQGDRIRVDVMPDVPAEVHVHGYELTKDTKPGQTAHFEFPGTDEGVFEVEVHHLVRVEEEDGVQVAELKVTP
jgi:hypothetical protein